MLFICDFKYMKTSCEVLLSCIAARFWVSGFKLKSVPLSIHFLMRLLVITHQLCMKFTDLHSSCILQDIQAVLALFLKEKKKKEKEKNNLCNKM